MLSPEAARRQLDRPVIGLLAGMGVRSTGPFVDLVMIAYLLPRVGNGHLLQCPSIVLLRRLIIIFAVKLQWLPATLMCR